MLEAYRVFCDLILDLGRKEKKLEVIRQVLCEIADFEPYSAFRRLDKSHKNLLDDTDFFAFFQQNHMEFSQMFIKDSLLQHYDLDGDGKLVYAEFLRCLLPADHPTLRTIVSQRPIVECEIYRLSEEIEYTLTKLLTEEVNVYVETEGKKRELAKLLVNGDYDALFLEIDDNNTGYIDFNNLMEFLQKNGIFPYEEEVIYILRRLDKDDDGRISLLELQNEVRPKESLGFTSGIRDKLNMSVYENSLGKLSKGSASKNYPYEAIRKSASPMKSQILKSPGKEIKEGSSKLRSYKKEYTDIGVNREYRDYMNVNKELRSSSKEREQIYESPKKRLEFESVSSVNKNVLYNNTSPNYKRTSEEKRNNNNNNNLKDIKSEIEREMIYSKKPVDYKSEIEREMSYSKKTADFKEIKSEIEREMHYNASSSSKYRTSPMKYSSNSNKTPEKPAFETATNYQSLTRKNVVNEGSLLEIAQFLKQIIRCERELQYLRGDLSLRPDYNIAELFNTFDKLMKGYLNPEEIEEFFESFDVFSSQEKSAFLARFCKTKEIFNFVDFVNVFQGNQESIDIGLQKNKRQSLRRNLKEIFSAETFSLMKEIVRTLVKNERILEESAKELLKRNPIDLKEVFAVVDVNKNGVLSEFEIKRFLEKNDVYFNDKDVKNLLDRVDRNKRRAISLNEFYMLFQS